MSKTIKVIELLNKIANGEEVPRNVNYSGKIFEFDELEKTYVTSNFDNTVMQGLDLYIDGLKEYSLNKEVEIIEEEPEIDIQGIEEISEQSEFGKDILDTRAVRINELIRAVKQLDHQINNK